MNVIRFTAEEREAHAEKVNGQYRIGLVIGIDPLCDVCQRDWGYDDEDEFIADIQSEQTIDEGGFSMHDCECCGSCLAGDRFVAHALDHDGNVHHFDVCVDCVQWIANGEPLPSEVDEEDEG